MSRHNNNRILFLTSSAPMREGDAASPFILAQAVELQKLGWEVEIIAPHAPGLAREDVLHGVNILRYRYMWPEHRQTLCYNGGIAQNLRRSRWNLLLVPCLIVSGYAFALRHIVRRRHALIHSHWLLPSGLQGRWLQWFFGIPHVVMAHGGDVFTVSGRIATLHKRLVINTADQCIANSMATAAALQTIAPGTKVKIIPTGVDSAPAITRQVVRGDYAATDTNIVMFVGRVVEEKGLYYAIEAVMHLKQEGRKLVLIVLGDGPDRQRCEAYAQELGVADAVKFIGSVPPEDVPSYLKIADIFVAPSCTGADGWVEGQGNSIVEAMIAGVPVVASNIGGIPDAVLHERTGLLVQERDGKSLARGLVRLMVDKEFSGRLSGEAKKHAEKTFARAECAQQISAIYKRLLKR